MVNYFCIIFAQNIYLLCCDTLIVNSIFSKYFWNIGNIDKSKLMNMFMKMDTNEIKRKLQNADLSKMSNINANDIINKLK